MMKNEGSSMQTLQSEAAELSNLTQFNQQLLKDVVETSFPFDTFTNHSSISLVKGSKEDFYSVNK